MAHAPAQVVVRTTYGVCERTGKVGGNRPSLLVVDRNREQRRRVAGDATRRNKPYFHPHAPMWATTAAPKPEVDTFLAPSI